MSRITPDSIKHKAQSKAEKLNLSPGKDAYYATGRRKTSVARVFLKMSGSGNIVVNKRLLDDYFARPTDRVQVRNVLEVAGVQHVDIIATVKGGGTTGQRGALLHAIARALTKYDATTRAALKTKGFLTRDAREVERKKYGLKKARKKEQFSKR